MTVYEQLEELLAPPHGEPSFLARVQSNLRNLELQINVKDGDRLTLNGRTILTDGRDEWWPVRIPKTKDNDHFFHDYQCFPIADYATDIGSTGWDWRHKRSLWWGFDFDAISGHALAGIDDATMAEVKAAASALDYVDVHQSTGGAGLHLYIIVRGGKDNVVNHDHHAAYGRQLLQKMSRDTKFDFTSAVDCAGGNMWFWSRRATAENGGFKLLKDSK
jgi:hypothetical protein